MGERQRGPEQRRGRLRARRRAERVAEAKAHEYWTQPHTIFHQIHEHQPSRLTPSERQTLNPLMALVRLKDCIPDDEPDADDTKQ